MKFSAQIYLPQAPRQIDRAHMLRFAHSPAVSCPGLDIMV